MTTELVIIAPVVIVILLLVVGLGRYAHGKQLVEQAAAAAARAASLSSTPSQAQDKALQAASGSLNDAGVSCASMSAAVDTTSFRAGGTVRVTLTCTADLSGLAMAGLPGSATMTATGAAPLETYRQYNSTTTSSTTGGGP
jgi:Flp pilus assembly protein TadG